MLDMTKLFSLLALCFLQQGPPADDYTAATQPSIAPVSWELKFRYQDPKRVSVVMPGEDEPVLYWYMLYTVENPTDEEVQFYPQFTLVTDTLKVVPSEIRVSPEAFRAIQRRAKNPLLVTPDRMLGTLRRGADHRRHGVAIFRDFDPKAKEFTVYVSGLSGEMRRIKNPAFDEEQPESDKNKRYILLRKTLAIPYKFPGGESLRNRAVPERMVDGQKWVMR